MKVLEIIFYSYYSHNAKKNWFKAIDSYIKNQEFKQLKLEICAIFRTDDWQQSFDNSIQSLSQLCDKNPKKLFTFKINKCFLKLVAGKRIINGIEYNVNPKSIPINLRISTNY